MKFQPLAIALSVALVLLGLNHIIEFSSYFAQAWLALKGFQWALFTLKSEPVPFVQEEVGNQESEVDDYTDFEEQVVALQSDSVFQIETEENRLIGTVNSFTDAIEMKTEPHNSIQLEKVEVVEVPLVQIPVPKNQLDQFIDQLESTLPAKKGKRSAWQRLCSQLPIEGAGKVRDASIRKKAEFLIDKGVSTPQLIKAKVQSLTLAA